MATGHLPPAAGALSVAVRGLLLRWYLHMQ